ncbi:tripartite motif-containing protein 75 [Mesocricetus auratus]|uniref:Tripartite motif-containing protein 75 n=1 Tax=Mesocricetus auratus TaxID=10036 RepID=A0A1U7QXP2_MESAU|nr:tripartite motif-containing protein 75 [Mesocricetus auratus]
MSRASVSARLQEQFQCHICLCDLQTPVTTECGHNFCFYCLQTYVGMQPTFSCPTCQHRCQVMNLAANAQLRDMIEMAQQLHRQTGDRKGQKVTTRCAHGVSAHFCEDDLQLVCHQCAGPESHNGHQVTPIAQAAAHHRERFRGIIKSLKIQVKEVQELRSFQTGRTQALREQVEAQRRELTSEFEQLNRFLDREQQAAFSRLKDEEKDIKQRLSENMVALENYISKLRGLVGHVVASRTLSDAEMLSTVQDFYKSSKSLRKPAIFSAQLRREAYNFPLQYSALQKVIQQFTVNVILDPESAHPQLLVSEDKKCVTLLKKKQHIPGSFKRFTSSPVVLGYPYFSSGRHFWEVKVGEKPEWAIGICKANLFTGARWSSVPQGCWRIVWQGDCFDVSGADPNFQQKATRASCIGVFLDYELGEVSFYSMPEKSHICTFRDTFTEPVCPYFYLGLHSEPLTLCSATDSRWPLL